MQSLFRSDQFLCRCALRSAELRAPFLCFREPLFRVFQLFRPLDSRAQALHLLLHLLQLPVEKFGRRCIFPGDLLEERVRLRRREAAFLRLFEGQAEHVLLVEARPANVLIDAPARVRDLAEQPHGLVFQCVLQRLIPLRPEDPAEDLLPRLRVGLQQLQEIALRDHRNLHELLIINAEDVLDGIRDVSGLCDDPPVRIREFRVRGLLRHLSRGASSAGCRAFRIDSRSAARILHDVALLRPPATLRWPFILRISLDGVSLVSI